MYGIKSGVKIARQDKPISLAAKSVIVVGGTKGIGRSLARKAAEAGASVTVVGRSLSEDDSLEPNISFLRGDVSTVSECRSIAGKLPFEKCDVLAFTAGIVPKNTRKVSADGIELDMAVSAMSRHVMIAEAAPRLPKTARVFVWGFPGSKGYYDGTKLDDFNSEKSFKDGFGFTHMNTVALNEALVHHWAANGMTIAGFNPGLISTGIRDPLHGGGCMGSIIEGLVKLFNPSVDAYAKAMLPLFVAPELVQTKGLLFHQDGSPIEGSPALDSATVEQWIDAADSLLARVPIAQQF